MPASGAARRESCAPPLSPTVTAVPVVAPRPDALGALAWAVVASTGHRLRRGEGALLAVNLSLIATQADGDWARAALLALVSTLAILVMYAFNDLYDAPADWNNPKKDHRLIATWVQHRRVGVPVTFVLKLLTLALALVTLGPTPAAAVAAVMIVNVVYSTTAKGMPVADILAVAVWGALYAAIVDPSPRVALVVALMTAICHLFQVLDDREPDAANGIQTTAVRSAALSRAVIVALTAALVAAVLGPLGALGACTALTPLAVFFLVRDAGVGWLFTKAYFAVMWLAVLGHIRAAG